MKGGAVIPVISSCVRVILTAVSVVSSRIDVVDVVVEFELALSAGNNAPEEW